MPSHKERVWLEEYLKCFNAAEAARRADYKWPNRIGTRKLAKFADEIEARIAEKAMSADEVLLRLAEIARAEFTDYVNAEGEVNLNALKADGKMHLIKGTHWDRNDHLVIKFCDQEHALELIGKHHGLFVERAEITGAGGKSLIPIDELVQALKKIDNSC